MRFQLVLSRMSEEDGRTVVKATRIAACLSEPAEINVRPGKSPCILIRLVARMEPLVTLLVVFVAPVCDVNSALG
jgi:hypothetical protein